MRVFDEQKYALSLLEHGFSKRMSGTDLLILAKYYRSLGKSEKEVEESIMSFCETFEPEYNETIYYEKINRIVRSSRNKNLRISESVPITQFEIDEIRGIKKYRYEKVMFVMLVLGKYYRITNKGSNSKYYFVADQPNTILSYAHASQKKGENIFCELNTLGFIDYINRTDCYFIKFTTVEDTTPVVTVVDNMNDILSFYPAVCEDCGKVIKKNGNNHFWCSECYRIHDNQLEKINYKRRK
jgi:hypothetical protein